MAKVSVVVPVYECAQCLSALHERLAAALAPAEPDFELILVEDCGRDGSWDAIESLARKDPRVKGLKLSRNFGQHAAIAAGLAEAAGDWAVVMDCDLQDPPEAVPGLLQKAREGFDVVYGRPRSKRHSPLRRFLASAYFTLLNLAQGQPVEGGYGNLSLFSRKVVDAYLKLQDLDRHHLFILGWLGFRSAVVDYDHAERASGRSSYTWSMLVRHAFGGVFFQTTRFLRWIIYFGFFLAISGLVMAAWLTWRRFYLAVPLGWTSLSVLILVTGGCAILCTGVTGLYIGKIFEQVRGRPVFVVDKRTGGAA